MKLFACFVFLFIGLKGITQVGLLSSNNKQQESRSGDTAFLPTLSISSQKLDAKLIPVGDTLPIQITSGPTIEAATEVSSYLTEAQKTISAMRSELAVANRSLANAKQQKEIERYRRRISLLTKNISDQAKEITKQQNQLAILNKKNLGSSALNTLLIGKVINARKKILNDSLTTIANDTKKIVKDLYRNQYTINSYWFLVDSTKETFNKNKFLDSLSTIYSDIREQVDEANTNREHTNKLVATFNSLTKEDTAVVINTTEDFDKYIKRWDDLSSNIRNLSTAVSSLNKAATMTVESYNKIIKNNIKDKITKKDDKTSDFGAFPQLTSILGKRETIPTLQVYGSYNYKSESAAVEGNIGLSFSPKGSPSEPNIYSMFLQQASTFLINSNFAYSFLTAARAVATKDSFVQRLALNLGMSYGGKSILFDTTKSKIALNPSIFYTKMGLELAILPKRLSIYGNINTATLFDKVSEFKESTGIDSKFFGFIDCGSKFYLDPSPRAQSDGLFIYVNTNFLINGGDVKRVTKSDDLVIPNIQVGIVKQLGKF